MKDTIKAVITGSPGTGKHTISGLVSDSLGFEIIDINQVAIQKRFGNKNKETIDVDVGKLRRAMTKKIKSSDKDTLIVGHLAPYVTRSHLVDKAIVLRKSPYELSKTYKERGYSEKKATENLGSEILGVIVHDCIKEFGNKVYEVDTTSNTEDDTLKKVISIILEKKPKHSDKVDWLGLVAQKEDMKRFFAYD